MNSRKGRWASIISVLGLFAVLSIGSHYKRRTESPTKSNLDLEVYKERLLQLRPKQIDEIATRLKVTSEQRRLLVEIITDCDNQVIRALAEHNMDKAKNLVSCAEHRIPGILREDQQLVFSQLLKEKRRSAAQFYAESHESGDSR